jgi:hypothetical protein
MSDESAMPGPGPDPLERLEAEWVAGRVDDAEYLQTKRWLIDAASRRRSTAPEPTPPAEPVAEPAAEPVAGPVAEPVAGPVAEPVAGPVAEVDAATELAALKDSLARHAAAHRAKYTGWKPLTVWYTVWALVFAVLSVKALGSGSAAKFLVEIVVAALGALYARYLYGGGSYRVWFFFW